MIHFETKNNLVEKTLILTNRNLICYDKKPKNLILKLFSSKNQKIKQLAFEKIKYVTYYQVPNLFALHSSKYDFLL